MQDLLEKMMECKQLARADAATLRRLVDAGEVPPTEEGILKWLAGEYALAYTDLLDLEPDKQLLSLFPARVLLKQQILPLRRSNGVVEVAVSRLFATEGLDTLKALTGLKLRPVLAPGEAIQREMKKRLGVGSDRPYSA